MSMKKGSPGERALEQLRAAGDGRLSEKALSDALDTTEVDLSRQLAYVVRMGVIAFNHVDGFYSVGPSAAAFAGPDVVAAAPVPSAPPPRPPPRPAARVDDIDHGDAPIVEKRRAVVTEIRQLPPTPPAPPAVPNVLEFVGTVPGVVETILVETLSVAVFDDYRTLLQINSSTVLLLEPKHLVQLSRYFDRMNVTTDEVEASLR
jgi:hypothetical protein